MTGAITFAAGPPVGFHRAAAEVCRRMSGCKDAPNPHEVEEAAARVLAGTAPGTSSAAS